MFQRIAPRQGGGVATHIGWAITTVASALSLGFSAPVLADGDAEETARVAEVRVFAQPFESLQDTALEGVRGRGSQAARMAASGALAVILWDEKRRRVTPNTGQQTGATRESAGAVRITYTGGVR